MYFFKSKINDVSFVVDSLCSGSSVTGVDPLSIVDDSLTDFSDTFFVSSDDDFLLRSTTIAAAAADDGENGSASDWKMINQYLSDINHWLA